MPFGQSISSQQQTSRLDPAESARSSQLMSSSGPCTHAHTHVHIQHTEGEGRETGRRERAVIVMCILTFLPAWDIAVASWFSNHEELLMVDVGQETYRPDTTATLTYAPFQSLRTFSTTRSLLQPGTYSRFCSLRTPLNQVPGLRFLSPDHSE